MDYAIVAKSGRKARQFNSDHPDYTRHPGRYADCKNCRRRIGDDQPRTWSTDPLGLVHVVCPVPQRAAA